MRCSIKFTALLAMLLLAFTVVGGPGANAQGDEIQLEDLEGIQHGVRRNYSATIDAPSTPAAETGEPGGLVSLSGVILEFANDDDAETGFDKFSELTVTQMAGEEVDATEIDLDLGDKSLGYTVSEDIGGQSVDTVLAIVQKDTYVYLVVVGGSGIDAQETTTMFVSYLIDTDGSGEGEFNEDGTSTGGLWDKFPAADDELVSGLMASDQMLYPEPEASPES